MQKSRRLNFLNVTCFRNLRQTLICLRTTALPSPQTTYICRVQSCIWRLPKYWTPTPSPPSECVLPQHQRCRGVHTRGGEGVGKQYFGRRQTLDCPLTVWSLYGRYSQYVSSKCNHILSVEITSVYVLYSTLLHLPPLRFHCVGGCWNRTQDICDIGIGFQAH